MLNQIDAQKTALERENAQLREALTSRIVIEQAKGVLAERLGLEADRAFDLLRRAARSERRRIHDLAEEVVASCRSKTPIEALAAEIENEGTPTARAAEIDTRQQMLFREVNEQIAELTARVDGIGMNLFICECSNDSCAESLALTRTEYEAVRAHGTRFIVLTGHQELGAEHVVGGNRRFLVVEEIGAGEVA